MQYITEFLFLLHPHGHFSWGNYQSALLIPLLGILAGILIPISVFIWLYHDAKGKRETVLEISKNLNDPEKIEDLLKIFDERKKKPLDYRRSGVIAIFVGFGLYLFGFFALGSLLKGVGALVSFCGIGTLIAGYLYPNTGKELTDAVEEFEKK
tara:strand:+ start:253 stop:711 length:459 start_codon:yes stop_codon:yes gene_type:complete